MNLQEIREQALQLSPDEQRSLIDTLTKALQPLNSQPKEPQKRNLSRLKGIAKRAGSTLSDDAITQDYTDYLTQKYS
ncbi:hypothetical protein C7B65_25740 [Phormidesmis priestleyi ULC007]|uniref:DUF2281 domain-containing protein n=1 Tax=Phormidesmis priestleyi ULC007 TaxID=1920490 RepID=A0A2T1D2Z9_9CYAN|nr:hypothetical protein [Phormidesmis priestleyi]PSB14868.1 hypothetical protein C7B65_25740 [Phormidesmis priestleyi ULC007]PZO45863.1 MAG: hypothetical protein DCF14_24545 [Phormidesmis priestleyi]